jgi:hypothetical protein
VLGSPPRLVSPAEQDCKKVAGRGENAAPETLVRKRRGEMSEVDEARRLHEEFLTEHLESLRNAYPGRPLPWYRMQLIKAMRDELRMSPRDTMVTVDGYYQRHGLAIPPPTLKMYVLTILAGTLVMLIPMGIVYWLYMTFFR